MQVINSDNIIQVVRTLSPQDAKALAAFKALELCNAYLHLFDSPKVKISKLVNWSMRKGVINFRHHCIDPIQFEGTVVESVLSEGLRLFRAQDLLSVDLHIEIISLYRTEIEHYLRIWSEGAYSDVITKNMVSNVTKCFLRSHHWFVRSIARRGDSDETEFFGGKLRMIARPIRLWKFHYWDTLGPSQNRRWGIQSPWMTLVCLRSAA